MANQELWDRNHKKIRELVYDPSLYSTRPGTLRTIAERARVSERTVLNHLRALKEEGKLPEDYANHYNV